jgi:Na+/glutamate symporter
MPMLHILIIVGWILAIVCMLYLAKEMVKDRWHARRERKIAIREAIRARRREQFMENRRRWMERNDGVILTRPAEIQAGIDRRHKQTQRLFAWVVLVMWEAYWVLEILDQFKQSDKPLQLPYFFLFMVMIVIPYCVYWFSTRRRRLERRRIKQGMSPSPR